MGASEDTAVYIVYRLWLVWDQGIVDPPKTIISQRVSGGVLGL